MSLILDALRKADAERERESVPGLHAQPVLPPPLDQSPRSRARPWLWAVVGLLAGLLASAGWYFVGRDAPARQAVATASVPPPVPATSAAAQAAPAPPSAVMTAPAAAAPVSAAVPSPRATPAATVAAPPLPAPPARPGAASQPPRPVEPQPVAEPAPWPESRKAHEKTTAAAKRIEIPVEQVAAAPSPQPVYTREQLPENIRAELPQFAVGGSIYSNNAAERSVIINGRIYRENDRLTADLTLEEIRLRAAVLRYKGYRFEIGF